MQNRKAQPEDEAEETKEAEEAEQIAKEKEEALKQEVMEFFKKKVVSFAKKNETLILFYLCFIILLATYMVATHGVN